MYLGIRGICMGKRKNYAYELKEELQEDNKLEAYRNLQRKDSYKIGVAARINSETNIDYIMEVSIRLCSSNSVLNLDNLRRKVSIMDKLQLNGYEIGCEDDNYIYCEKNIEESELMTENTFVQEIFKNER